MSMPVFWPGWGMVVRPMGRESGFKTWLAASLELVGCRGSPLGGFGGISAGSGALEGELGDGLGCVDI